MDRAGSAPVSLEQVQQAIAEARRRGVLPRNAVAPDAADMRRELAARVREFARTFSFDLELRGTHYSGLSNEDLFDILADQGRDFGADTRQLRTHVQLALIEQFDGGQFLPGEAQLRQIAAVAVLEWVVARMESKIHDVRLRRLTRAYALEKRRAGYGDRPIGVRTGALLDALREAHVDVTHEPVDDDEE